MSKTTSSLRKIIEDISIRSDEHSFNQFFHKYCSRLYSFAFQITGNQGLSEEIVSDVFTKLWNNRQKLLEIDNLEGYLYRAIRNQSLSTLRKNNDKDRTYTQITPEVFVTDVSPETSLLDAELEKIIQQTIEELPKAQQMIFRLVKNDGLHYKEVAGILEISVSTVETQMVRALKRLRSSIQSYLDNQSSVYLRKHQ